MKKVLIYLLSTCLIFSLLSCGEDKKQKEVVEEEDTGKWFMAQTDAAPVANVSATSELVEAQFAGNYLYPPVNIVDGDLDSTWCEADENGSGIGEAITIEFSEPVSFDEIQVVNGFASTAHPDYYKKNNRVKKIQLTQIAGEHFQTKAYTLADDTPDWQSINFELPQTAQFVEIKLLEIYPGDKYDDTCFDDIRFLYQGKVIPFKGVDSLKDMQVENSKAMLNSDFEQKFANLTLDYNYDGYGICLRQPGKDSGLYLEWQGGKDYVIYDCFMPSQEKNIVYINQYYSQPAKLGNCRLTVTQRIDYVEVQTVKLVKIDGNTVTINGISYKVVPPSKDLQFEDTYER